MVSIQGAYDGFCGIYAIVNAMRLAGALGGPGKSNSAELVFTQCCEALPKSCWPHVAWEGIHQDYMKVILKSLVDTILNFPMVTYPFENRKFRSHETFWAELLQQLVYDGVVCAIAWQRYPIDHWLVVQRDGLSLRFTDSNPDEVSSTYTRPASKIGSGASVIDQSLSYLDRREVVVFSRPVDG